MHRASRYTRLVLALLSLASQLACQSNAPATEPVIAAPPDAAKVDVFLLAGQSNMEGVGRAESLPPSALSAPGVFLYHSQALGAPGSADRWLPLRPAGWKGNFDGDRRMGLGVELSIGASLSRASPAPRVYLIKHAVGGTDLAEDWEPDRGPQYRTLEDLVDRALQALEAEGLSPTVRAVFWQQGETDSIVEAKAQNYEERLVGFIAHLRRRLGPYAPDGTPTNIRFVLGQVIPDATPGSKADNTYPYRETIRAAQLAVPLRVPNTAVVPTDPSFETHASTQDGYRDDDNIHFNAAGLTKLGEHMAAAYLAGSPAAGSRR